MDWKERISVDEVGCSGVADVLFIDNVAVSLTEEVVDFIESEKQKSFEEGLKTGANGLLTANSNFVLGERKRVTKGDSYWFITEGLSVYACFESGEGTDYRFEVGNYFRTKKEAEEVASMIKKLLMDYQNKLLETK